ncbi:cobyrinate a,c-diamide synthase [Lachnospiraceae bacterium 45-W7]
MSGNLQRSVKDTEIIHVKLPRLMLAAPASGSGKTLITCGILQALKNRGIHAASFKCGPDYIDPLFHREILGIPSRNLDTFFTGRGMTRYLFGRAARDVDIAIVEGVMGYYDGAGGDSLTASSYELAKITDTPVILIVNAKGMSLSVTALIQGFMEYKKHSRITGVILNQISSGSYGRLKEIIERELSIAVLGYVPQCAELVIDSRHLGLVMPEEVAHIRQKMQKLSELLEETLDMERLLSCARQAPVLRAVEPQVLHILKRTKKVQGLAVGIARDEAFCFLYQDNLELLAELGAELVYFSPLHDRKLPENISGLLLCGGYPELYAQTLSQNSAMRESIKKCITKGMPYLAECGGYLYLQESMEDLEGTAWSMTGVFPGKAYRTNRLGRFGYITLAANNNGQLLPQKSSIKGHEYHYYDCTENGGAYHARKPAAGREWDCIQGGETYAAGFPHLYYYSNPQFAAEFLQRCKAFQKDAAWKRFSSE